MLAAFWSRTEYRSKQIAPWSRLWKGSASADRSLLLDYISPFPPTVIIRAVKNGDLVVALSTTGSLLITLLIVISTGLLALQLITMKQQDVQLTVSTAFTNKLTGLATVGSMPLYTIQGIQNLGLSYLLGTTSQYAYQSFNSSETVNATVLRGVVDGFLAELDCDQGSLSVDGWTMWNYYDTPSGVVPQTEQNLSVSTSSCHIPKVEITANEGVEGAITTFGFFISAACANTHDNDGQRILLMVGEYLQGSTVNDSASGGATGYTTHTNFSIPQSTQLVCKPSYSISKVAVTLNSTRDPYSTPYVDIEAIPNKRNRTLSNVHPWQIAEVQFQLTNTIVFSDDTYGFGTLDPQLAFGLYQRPNLTYHDLLNPYNLGDVATRSYQLFAAQIARRALMEKTQTGLQGTAYVNEARLMVRELSVRLMEAILALLSLFTMSMLVLIPKRSVVPRDPGSIAGLALSLSQSRGVLEPLRDMGSARTRQLLSALSHSLYDSKVIEGNDRPTFRVCRSRTAATVPDRAKDSTSLFKWYRPFAVTIYARLMLLTLVIAAITALEIVLRLSQRNNGLSNVSSGGYLHYLWAYIPALAMVSIALFFTSLDFTTKVFAPYAKLKSSGSFQNSLSINPLDSMALPSLWTSMRTQHWAAAATTAGMLLGSYLTIVVSGVYSTTNVPETGTVSLQRRTWFNASAAEYYMGLAAPVTAGLIISGNLSYPAWTYNDLTLPSLGISTTNTTSPSANADLGTSSTVGVRLPSIRSAMNCTMYRGEKALNANLTWGAVQFEPDNPLVLNIPASSWCTAFMIPVLTLSVQPNTIFGRANDNGGGVDGCSPFSFFWGSISEHSIEHVAAMICDEHIEQIEVDATFRTPGYSVDTTAPPIPDESTRKPFSTAILETANDFLPDIPSTGNFDNFFTSLVYGKDSIPASDLSSTDDDVKVSNAIQSLHKLIRAQQYSEVLRIPASPEIKARTLNGTVTNPNHLRLIQNPISTRVLEALLGAMLICAIAAALLMDTRRVLPKNPCTIAAVASFIADAKFMDQHSGIIPEGAEWMSDKELERSGIFKGYKFRAGWIGGTEETPGKEKAAKTSVSAGARFAIDIIDTDDSRPAAKQLTIVEQIPLFTEDVMSLRQ